MGPTKRACRSGSRIPHLDYPPVQPVFNDSQNEDLRGDQHKPEVHMLAFSQLVCGT